jgi:hypothetical protein
MPKAPSVVDLLTQSMEARVQALAARSVGPVVPESVARLSQELTTLYRMSAGVQARLPFTMDVR